MKRQSENSPWRAAGWALALGVMLASAGSVFAAPDAASDSKPVVVATGTATNVYALAETEGARAYVEAYADNVQFDRDFRAHEAAALATVRRTERFFGSGWSLLPALVAILLALLTKEVYSALFVGILSGGLLYADFSFERTLTHVFQDGFIACVATPTNIGILLFLVFLGTMVAMMNKTGATAAFGRWAETHIKSRIGAQVATILLGILIFIDDYFNCLTVGSVMKPVTDAKGVSRAKLAYLIDSTAAPICIIAPVSSWAAAVAGFVRGTGADSGFSLFIRAIPYNFYALLTILMLFVVACARLDFGPMRRCEREAQARTGKGTAVSGTAAGRGSVFDLLLPTLALVAACVLGMVYSGGFFGTGATAGSFVRAFAAADASVGLVLGSALALLFTIGFYLCRRVVGFRVCMESLPEGFKAMVPAILILCSSWALKGMTDSLGAKVFVSDLVNGPAGALRDLLPAVFFLVSAAMAFSTGTSWGTFGILIPICLAAMPSGEMSVMAISACMAGAVCGDHCSPISDTSIMSSAGAECPHMLHVVTQLPYVAVCAVATFVGYCVAPFAGSPWTALAVAAAVLAVELAVFRLAMGRSESASV